MPTLLVLAFFLTAVIYASVGFGGGSTYTAVLALSDVDYRILPVVSLGCNIVVVAGGVWQFGRAGHIHLARVWPFLVASIPAAWLGGLTPVSQDVFLLLLGISLLLVGVRLLWVNVQDTVSTSAAPIPTPVYDIKNALVFAIMIGYLSGLVGIGGGIFLAPVLYFWRWGSPKEIAALASLFILCNSVAGLIGQLTKLNDPALIEAAAGEYWGVLAAVLIGGQLGSRIGVGWLSGPLMQRLTGFLILVVAIRVLYSVVCV